MKPIKLNNRVLLRVFGRDSETFLQSQFSNNILRIKNQHIQVNSYCQHQGKVISIIWVFRQDNEYYLSFPLDLKEIVISRLKLFRLMSEFELEDLSDKFFQYGLIGKHDKNAYKINDNLSLLINKKSLDCDNYSIWERKCIESCLPDISLKTSEKLIPQDLNLDIDEFGVSFNKGCYPGQEVVARMHYLGKPKRRLFYFETKSKASVGDSINVGDSNSLKSSGVVIRVCEIGGTYHILGTLEIKYTNDQIYINNNIKNSLNIINAKAYIS